MRRLACLLLLALPAVAAAGPADYVYTPSVEYGEREIDFKIGHQQGGGQERLSAASLGLGFGVTERWFTEIYTKFEKPGGESGRYDAFEWENRFLLTEPNRYPLDVGFVIEIERPRNRAEGTEFRLGPLFQTDYDRWRFNFNVLFERSVNADEPSRTELGYQFQARYFSRGNTDFGVQAFGEMGPVSHWDPGREQTHRVGPAIFGKFPLGGRNVIQYNAAVLFGLTSGAPDRTLRAQVEYEF
jgi:hypothetical protein